MSVTQAVVTILAVYVTLFVAQTTFFIMYINAKIDPVAKQVNFLAQYMVEHSERIATLEERTNPGGKKNTPAQK